jgi:hypothetical protein
MTSHEKLWTWSSRCCLHGQYYSDFLDRAKLLTQKLHRQDYVVHMSTNILRSSSRTEWPVPHIYFPLRRFIFTSLNFINNTASVLDEKETTDPSRAPGCTPGFLVGSMLLICYDFFVVILFVCLPHVSRAPIIASLSGLFIVVCSLLFSLSFIW